MIVFLLRLIVGTLIAAVVLGFLLRLVVDEMDWRAGVAMWGGAVMVGMFSAVQQSRRRQRPEMREN